MIQQMLPIEFAPEDVRYYGLRDAHSRPLVSWGKDERGDFTPSFRVSPEQAWEFPSLELRAANSWPCLIFDLDGRRTVNQARRRWTRRDLPPPSWIVQKASGGAHAVYTLVTPVHRGPLAAERPLRLLSRISEFYSMELQADAGYSGVLSHNPTFTDPLLDGSHFETTWWNAGGYDLKALSKYIPARWRKPIQPVTETGRNCYLFAYGMRWAGSYKNLGSPVLEIIVQTNEQLETALSFSECKGIARSVERYRAGWIGKGRFYSQEESAEWGRDRGRRGGKKRRGRTAGRDRYIVFLHAQQLPSKEIATSLGLTQRRVNQILRRRSTDHHPPTHAQRILVLGNELHR